jgi:hypothetical protein
MSSSINRCYTPNVLQQQVLLLHAVLQQLILQKLLCIFCSANAVSCKLPFLLLVLNCW